MENTAMTTTTKKLDEKFPLWGQAGDDGAALRLFLAAEVVCIAARRGLPPAEVARGYGVTEMELDRLIKGGDEADLWKIFKLLQHVGGVAVVGVDGQASPENRSAVLWTRIPRSAVAPTFVGPTI